jgi:hypothetical protein
MNLETKNKSNFPEKAKTMFGFIPMKPDDIEALLFCQARASRFWITGLLS